MTTKTRKAAAASKAPATATEPEVTVPTQSVGKHDHDRRVQSVKEHALANYETAGWDIVVETMDDDAIYEVVKRTQTEKGAIAKMAAHVGVVDEVRTDIQNA